MKKENNILIYSASDLQNYLACKRITFLDIKAVNKELTRPNFSSTTTDTLRQLGYEHEERYLRHLEEKGLRTHRLEKSDSPEKTIAAMSQGYDIIAQPKLVLGNWMGYADVLIKREGKSKLGDYYYEVQDTKLSQVTKGATILQLSLYSEMLNAIQGNSAKVISAIKPGNPYEQEDFSLVEFDAYYRYIKQRFENELKNGVEETYPLPVEKCTVCPWWKSCRGKWITDDHLSLVAGLQRSHVKTLNEQDILTIEEYAKEPKSVKEKPEQGSLDTFDKIHGQAKVQFKGRTKDKYFELRPDWFKKTEELSENKGLNQLPKPHVGDIYFDFEGDHFYPDGGIEYLFGYTVHNPKTKTYDYHKLWALNRVEEKSAFEQFMLFLKTHAEEHPDFHIYHFAPYEPAALSRLASRHAMYEVEVDDLLRTKKFVDLHRVIKESMQVAVERYSLKDLESFAGFERTIDLQVASEARRVLGAGLNLNCMDRVTEEDKTVIEEYNKDDCMATWKIHEWLEQLFQENKNLHGITRPELDETEVDDKIRDRELRAQQLYDQLFAKLPTDKESDEYRAMWLLLNSISYFRREERMQWFDYFRLRKLQPDELMDEKGAISSLRFEGIINIGDKMYYRYLFDPQEISGDFRKADARFVETEGKLSGTIKEIDFKNYTIDISTKAENYNRTICIQLPPIAASINLERALQSYVAFIIANGFKSDPRYNAVHDLLLRRSPRLLDRRTLADRPRGDLNLTQYALSIVNDLDESILPIQGPPGTGKTHLGGQLILNLLKRGKKIGVTAVGHKTIQNLILKTKEHALKEKYTIETAHVNSREMDGPEDYAIVKTDKAGITALNQRMLVGATAFFWTKDAVGQPLDYLFIDEAGQMSLTQIIAASKAAKNLILLGDPQQLEQPQQGAHPENSDVSGLDHLLGELDTIPVDKGIFLDTTWRLPASICKFTSELYYDGRLTSHPDTTNQNLLNSRQFTKTGLYYVPVTHEGNQNKSEEEIEVVVQIVEQLLKDKCAWTDRSGKSHPLTKENFRIIAPYNIQVNSLQDRLPDFQIGTVDKFQGQEAPVVIYSMTSSSPEDAPRGMGFLYDPHRLNVATSRAQCVSILIASPKLFEPECHSVEQMRFANGLCKYKEMAEEIVIR